MRPVGLVSWLTIAALSGCDGAADAADAQPDADVLLVVDGDLVVRSGDVEPFDAYFEALDPTMGTKYRTREVLGRFLLPLLLARRAFPAERADALARAEALRAVADNSLELRRKGALAGGAEPDEPLFRNQLDFRTASWAFRPENLGAVSPPIETPRGYLLIAPIDLEPGLTPVADRLRAFLVEFPTHDEETFDAWLATARTRLRGRVDHVAPRLAGALPFWLEP